MSEPEKPSRIIKACNGSVRKLVNWLPLGAGGSIAPCIGNDKAGDKRIAAGSPFTALFIACLNIQNHVINSFYIIIVKMSI